MSIIRGRQAFDVPVRLLICIAATLAVVAILAPLHLVDRPLAAALNLFLIVVLLVSTGWGTGYAIFISFLSAVAFSWLIPPAGHFHLRDPRMWALLATCLVTGLTASYLAGHLRRALLEANRRRAEAVAEQQRFANLVNSVEGIVWEAGGESFKFSYVNQQAERILGYSVENWLSDPAFWKDHLHPEDRDRAVQIWIEAATRKHNRDFEYRMIAADGRVVWMRDLITVVVEDGQPPRLRGVMVDITERKEAEEAARRSQKELSEVVETIPTIAWTASPDGFSTFVNRRWTEYTGLSVEDTAGTGWHAIVHPEDLERFTASRRASLSTGQPFEDEVRFRSAADGQYRWFLVRAVPVLDEHGNIIKWYGTVTDIDDRKRAEALLAGEKRILEMVAKGDSLPQILDSLCRFVEEQTDGALVSVLLLYGDRLRHGAAPSLPTAYTNAIDGGVIGPSAGSCGTAAYSGQQVIVEDIGADPLWADYRDLALRHSLRACWSTPIFSSEGQVIATFAMYYRERRRPGQRDQEIIEQITHLAGIAIQRKSIEEKLRQSEAYLAESQRLSHTGSFVWDIATRDALYLSDEWCRIYGFDPGDNQSWQERLLRIRPEDRSRWQAAIDQAITAKSDYELEYRIDLPYGITKYIHTLGHPVLNDAGEVLQFMGTLTDITERKRAEEELLAAETRFRTYVDHATDALFVIYELGYIADVNRQACESLGYTREELLGMSPRDFDVASDPKLYEKMRDRLEAGEIWTYETSHRRKDGTTFPVEVRVRRFWDGSRPFALALARDITDRKHVDEEREKLRQLEAELAHINRVTTMGELTASLAHEINQPIAAAMTNANTCVRWLTRENPDIQEAHAAATRIVKDTQRAAEIISRVRRLFKKGAPQREWVDVNAIMNEIVALLRNEASRKAVTIRSELAVDAPQVMGDRVQLQQVFMNLMLNGFEAMKAVDGKRELTLKSQYDSGNQLMISVSDTGIGLPPEISRIFEPFYTTKPNGIGMGLAISRNIIESHGGRLWASSNSGHGAIFYFTLPASLEVRQ